MQELVACVDELKYLNQMQGGKELRAILAQSLTNLMVYYGIRKEIDYVTLCLKDFKRFHSFPDLLLGRLFAVRLFNAAFYHAQSGNFSFAEHLAPAVESRNESHRVYPLTLSFAGGAQYGPSIYTRYFDVNPDLAAYNSTPLGIKKTKNW
jgi:hypothetical protein